MEIEYQIINQDNNFCTKEYQFINLLKSNNEYEVNTQNKAIKYENLKIGYSIQKYKTVNNNDTIFIVKFNIDDEKGLDKFEEFDKSILSYLKKFNDISVNILKDDISKYYGNVLYPKIFDIENLLRKVIYCFMGKNVGKEWTKKCFPKEISEYIQRTQNVKQGNNENILYYVDFIQLERFLFMKFPLKDISKVNMEKLLKEEDNQIQKFIDDYAYKSNWERYFEKEVNSDSLSEDLNELYKYRNAIAHNRNIRKETADKVEEKIKTIKKILDLCLEKGEMISVPETEKEVVSNISTKIFNLEDNLSKTIKIRNIIDGNIINKWYVDNLGNIKVMNESIDKEYNTIIDNSELSKFNTFLNYNSDNNK